MALLSPQAAPLLIAVSSFSAASYSNCIFVIGGGPNGKLATSSLQCFEAAANKWTLKSPMPIEAKCTNAVTFRDSIYVVGNGTLSNDLLLRLHVSHSPFLNHLSSLPLFLAHLSLSFTSVYFSDSPIFLTCLSFCTSSLSTCLSHTPPSLLTRPSLVSFHHFLTHTISLYQPVYLFSLHICLPSLHISPPHIWPCLSLSLFPTELFLSFSPTCTCLSFFLSLPHTRVYLYFSLYLCFMGSLTTNLSV